MQVIQLKFTHRKYIIHPNEYIISPINLLSLLFCRSGQPFPLAQMGINVKKKQPKNPKPSSEIGSRNKLKENFSGQVSKLAFLNKEFQKRKLSF